MLGITGASGAPYAAGAEVGVCASRAGRQVIALEIYGDREMDGSDALERFFADHAGGDVRIWEERDYTAPYASGSSRTDAVIISPCWMDERGSGVVQGSVSRSVDQSRGETGPYRPVTDRLTD